MSFSVDSAVPELIRSAFRENDSDYGTGVHDVSSHGRQIRPIMIAEIKLQSTRLFLIQIYSLPICR